MASGTVWWTVSEESNSIGELGGFIFPPPAVQIRDDLVQTEEHELQPRTNKIRYRVKESTTASQQDSQESESCLSVNVLGKTNASVSATVHVTVLVPLQRV